jgi:hypothetical protein
MKNLLLLFVFVVAAIVKSQEVKAVDLNKLAKEWIKGLPKEVGEELKNDIMNKKLLSLHTIADSLRVIISYRQRTNELVFFIVPLNEKVPLNKKNSSFFLSDACTIDCRTFFGPIQRISSNLLKYNPNLDSYLSLLTLNAKVLEGLFPFYLYPYLNTLGDSFKREKLKTFLDFYLPRSQGEQEIRAFDFLKAIDDLCKEGAQFGIDEISLLSGFRNLFSEEIKRNRILTAADLEALCAYYQKILRIINERLLHLLRESPVLSDGFVEIKKELEEEESKEFERLCDEPTRPKEERLKPKGDAQLLGEQNNLSRPPKPLSLYPIFSLGRSSSSSF